MVVSEKTANALSTFGAELRAHRTRAGLSQADLAARLYISSSLEGAIENATRVPKRGLAEHCDEIFGTTGTFVRLWKLTAQQAYPSWFSQYAELETEATKIHKWELRYIPGLLQTDAPMPSQGGSCGIFLASFLGSEKGCDRAGIAGLRTRQGGSTQVRESSY